MMSNFPSKYFLIFANSPESKVHHNNINAGLRIALTLVMDEVDVHILLTEEAIHLLRKSKQKTEQLTLDKYGEQSNTEEGPLKVNDETSFTPYELIDGLISFGAHIMTCKSSFTLTGLKEEDLVDGVDIVNLHSAIRIMMDCDKVLIF